jgi:uncharacterized DUF497 family protein
MHYDFEWNPDKAKKNIKKHKVSFDRATSVFRDPNAISIVDEGHSKKEERWLTMGLDSSGILLIVSHTFIVVDTLACKIRIISARKPENLEAKQY